MTSINMSCVTCVRLFYWFLLLNICVSDSDTCSASNTDDVCGENQSDGNENNENNEKTEIKYDNCRNIHKDCDYWASIGECDANPNYMLYYCAKGCNTCHLQTDEHRYAHCQNDEDQPCEEYANEGECHKNPRFMRYFHHYFGCFIYVLCYH